MNKFIFIIILILTGCKLENRIKIIKLHSSIVSVSPKPSENGCYSIRDYNGQEKSSIIFWFEINYVSDGTKSSDMFSYQREGGDGPIDSLEKINIFLVDSVNNKVKINSLLYNDSSILYFHLSEELDSRTKYGRSVEVNCDNPNEHNCKCEVSTIYKSIDSFIDAFNKRKNSVKFKNLEAPLFLHIDESKLSDSLLNYKKMIFEITLIDGSILSEEYIIKQ